MEKIALISSPGWAQSRIVPHALIELSAYIEGKGIPVHLVDVKRDPFAFLTNNDVNGVMNEILGKLSSIKPEYIGLSVFTVDYWKCRELASRIKEKFNAKIIVGGIHPTLKPEDFFFKGSPFDIIAIGEGEDTLYEILSGKPLQDINGIAFLKNGSIVRTPSRSFIKDLSVLPRPSYEKLDMEFYLEAQRDIIRTLVISGVHILTGRGCPYQCTFCATRILYESQGLAPILRHRPVKNVITNLKWLRDNYFIDAFNIYDDTFTLPREKAKEFCAQYKSSGLDMPWAAQTRVNLVDDDLIAELKTAGCVQLDFGVESGSDEALSRMKKGTTSHDARNAFKLCRKHGLRTFANIMFNTPGETEDDVKKTLSLMKDLKASHYGIALTMPLPGTKIFEDYIGDKLTKEEYVLFSTPCLFQKIVDPRFRLASHSLDIDKLYMKVNLRYYLLNSFFEMTFGLWYWKSFFSSKRKSSYFRSFFKYIIKQIKVYIRAMISLFENSKAQS